MSVQGFLEDRLYAFNVDGYGDQLHSEL